MTLYVPAVQFLHVPDAVSTNVPGAQYGYTFATCATSDADSTRSYTRQSSRYPLKPRQPATPPMFMRPSVLTGKAAVMAMVLTAAPFKYKIALPGNESEYAT
jgi:hypothetical protein